MNDAATPDERWLPVVGFDVGADVVYEVSSLGRVWSPARWVKRKDCTRATWRQGRYLKQSPRRDGYPCVRLGRGKGKLIAVHLLVARAFLGSVPPGMEVLHGPAGALVPAATNLRYGTRSENNRDQLRDGTNHSANKVTCPRDHVLKAPNLVRLALEHGYRTCLACSRARTDVRNAKVRHGIELDLATRGDHHYALIMQAAVA